MPSRRRLSVHIHVTPYCNLECKHCYYDSSPANTRMEYSLSVADVVNIIVSLCEKYDAFFDIEGGEIFLRDDISRLFDVLPPDYWGRITITTNGITKITLNSDIMLNLDEFRVSVEGHTNELQREIRGIDLTPVMKTCTELKSAGVPLVLRITLHRKNYRYLVEMLRHFVKQGFAKFSLYEFQATGRGLEHELEYALSESELARIFKDLLASPLAKDVELLKISLGARRTSLIHSMMKELEQNGYEIIDLSGAASLVVNHDRSLGVCPWKAQPESIGHYDPVRFPSDIRHYVENGQLDHLCNHCSAIRVQYNPGKR